MNRHQNACGPCRGKSVGGFTLIELMVAVAIALFLIGGLVTVLQHIRTTSAMQTGLAQLQDNERLAMTLISGVVESAGYYPNPSVTSAAASMPIGAGSKFTVAGAPVITGVTNFNAQGDSMTVRYAAAANDNVFNCQGGINGAGSDSWENTFYVSNGSLWCDVWTASTKTVVKQPLVSGVQNISILYGVNTLGAGNGTCTDTYMTAAQVSAALGGAGAWANVCSAVVTLTFTDPTGPAQPAISFKRVIALMQTAGVTS